MEKIYVDLDKLIQAAEGNILEKINKLTREMLALCKRPSLKPAATLLQLEQKCYTVN